MSSAAVGAGRWPMAAQWPTASRPDRLTVFSLLFRTYSVAVSTKVDIRHTHKRLLASHWSRPNAVQLAPGRIERLFVISREPQVTAATQPPL